jgi:hypothetical protein
MPSTYTTNLGIEKIATGEQSGTWGGTTNTNFDILDQAINGIETVTLASAGNSGSPNTLAITDGAVSSGRNKFIEFDDGGDLGATAFVQLTPDDAEKIVIIRNSLSASRSLIVFQGTYNASNDFEIANGKDVVLKFDGAGAGATVTQVFADLNVTALDATTVAATTIDTTNIEVTNIKAKDGTSAGSIADSTGVVTLASSVLTTTDINGGTIDGATIGASSASTGVFTQVDIEAEGDLRLQDASGGEYVGLQAPATVSASYTLTMPAADGSNGQALVTNGSGTLSFESAGISTGKAIAMAIVFG